VLASPARDRRCPTPALRSHPMADLPSPETPPSEPPRQATLKDVAGAVIWGFLGVRKGKAMQRDVVSIRPWQVVVVGLLAGAAFVVALLVLVRLIVASAGSA
jgi:hypothetical protein